MAKQNMPSSQVSADQAQTADAFGFKWSRRDSYESPEFKAKTRQWLVDRYCRGDRANLAAMLGDGRKVILDAGCGAGYSALLLFDDLLREHDYIGLDISSAVEVAEQRFKEAGHVGTFICNDLVQAPLPDESVDLIFSEGVLHHTDSVETAILALSRKLKPGGLFLFYVYIKKAPIREFTDDLVRSRLLPLDNEQAWEALKPLTKLGAALGEMDAFVDVPEEIFFLGIPKGRISVQRLFYWYICKMFYSPELELETMNHINFDWFRPLNCIRSTPEEVRAYCSGAGLDIEHMDIQQSGITVVARKATR